MKTFKVNKIDVNFLNTEGNQQLAEEFVTYAERHKKFDIANIESIDITINEKTNQADIDVKYSDEQPDFERVRRITGYLATLSRFNNAKRAEVADRVKHI